MMCDMKIAVISGSPRKNSNTQIVMQFVLDYLKTKSYEVVFVNLSKDIECFRGTEEMYNDSTKNAVNAIMSADIWLIGCPIYNSFFSSALKNIFEYINYKGTSGKIAGLTIVASGNIGFIYVQTLLTQLMSYFRVITNPKAVYLTVDVIKDGIIIDENTKARLKEMVDETIRIATKLI